VAVVASTLNFVRRWSLLLLIAVAGCGGPEPDQADSVLSRADADRVEGALERVDYHCSEGAREIGLRGLRTLVAVAEEHPHATYGVRNYTMIQVLESVEDDYPNCGFAKDLGDTAQQLRKSR
jgi:hypothetical protein